MFSTMFQITYFKIYIKNIIICSVCVCVYLFVFFFFFSDENNTILFKEREKKEERRTKSWTCGMSFQNTYFKHPKLRTLTQTLFIKNSTKHTLLFGNHSFQCLNTKNCSLSLHTKHTLYCLFS